MTPSRVFIGTATTELKGSPSSEWFSWTQTSRERTESTAKSA